MWVPLLLLLPELLPAVPAQKLSALTFLRVDQDKDKECSLDCAGSPQKSLCASDGRTFLSRCEFQRAKCKDPQLEIAYRGNCKEGQDGLGENTRDHTYSTSRRQFSTSSLQLQQTSEASRLLQRDVLSHLPR